MADLYEELVEEIKQMIEEDVTFDFQGNPLGHERVAEALAYRIEYLVKDIQRLEEELRQAQVTMDSYAEENQRFFDENEQLKAKLAAKSWDGSVDRQGGSFDDWEAIDRGWR